MISTFIFVSVTLLCLQEKLMTLPQSPALSAQIAALDSLGAYAIIQLAVAILGVSFYLAVLATPKSFYKSRLYNKLSRHLKNNEGDEKIPDHVITMLARMFLPDILEFYSTEEGNAKFEAWKREQEEDENTKKTS